MTDTRQNPFVGLRPYESSDSLFYFGRGEQVKTLLRQLHQHRFVAVVGSSGSGKSSLIRAGLIPQLEAGFLVQDRDQWLVARMKPGEEPIGNLVGSLRDVVGEELPFTVIREQGSQAILDLLTPYLMNSDTNLFILVDQFEELFRFGLEKGKAEQRQEAEEFVALLLALSRQESLPIYVCLTMRSDFLGDCDAFYGLPEAINQSQFLVPRLTRSQRQEVITHPVHLAGARIAPRLVDRLLNEGIDTRDDLPVFQHALMRTWDAWQAVGATGLLDIQHYEQVHTIYWALDRHANEALEELDTYQQDIAKKLFQVLTAVDAGNRRIRRPVHLDDICAITAATQQEVMEVINRFREQGRSFLVLSSEILDDNPLIDISHESLIRQWRKLEEWVDEEAEAAKTYRRLVETAQLYSQGKASLYRDTDLDLALNWWEQLSPNRSVLIWAMRYHLGFDVVRDFLEKSKRAHEQRVAEAQAKQEYRIREQRKKLVRTRWLSAVMTMIALMMLAVAWLAWHYAEESTLAKQDTDRALEMAKKNEKDAKKNEKDANYNLAKAFEEKSLSSIERGLQNERVSDVRREEIRKAWLYALEAEKLGLVPISYRKLAIINEEAFSSKQTLNLNLYADVNVLAFSPDGKVLASGKKYGVSTLQLWDSVTGVELKSFSSSYHDSVSALMFSPDGKVLASAGGEGDSMVRLWDVVTGAELKTLKGHIAPILAVTYNPDGKILASAGYDETVRLWDVVTGAELKTLNGHTNAVSALAYSPDGKLLASASWDKTVRLWDTVTGVEHKTLSGHTDVVTALAYSPDGKVLASASKDKTVRLWDVLTGVEFGTLNGHTNAVSALVYSPDGKVLASASEDKTVRLWDVVTGEEKAILQGHNASVNTLAYSPDGKIIASGGSYESANDKTVQLWKLAGPAYRLLYDFEPAELSAALRFLWQLELDELEFNYKRLELTDETKKYLPLLASPYLNETKIDQLVHFLGEQNSYKKLKQLADDESAITTEKLRPALSPH